VWADVRARAVHFTQTVFGENGCAVVTRPRVRSGWAPDRTRLADFLFRPRCAVSREERFAHRAMRSSRPKLATSHGGAPARALLKGTRMRDPNNNDKLNTIDMCALEHVRGGARQWAKGPDNSAITTALQTVVQSIDSLKNQPNSNSSMMMMLPMMLMMRNRG